MLISQILAWITVLLFILAALKFIARKSGSRALNRSFRRIHIPFGFMALISGALHGFFAGNRPGTRLTDFKPAPVLFSLNFGSACFVLIIVLAVTYLLRKKLKKRWILIHRISTLAAVTCLVVHLFSVGIYLPKRILGGTAETVTHALESTNPVKDESDMEVAREQTSQPPQTLPDAVFSGAYLSDGTYTGSGEGYNGIITVSVTVEGGKVTGIHAVSHSDTERIFDRAKSVLNDIVGSQSLEVDAVSGATYSSTGLINAVYNALRDAVISGELTGTKD